jgi:hypothetical protein
LTIIKTGMKPQVMKNIALVGYIMLLMIFFNLTGFAQTQEWKTETADNGKITVKYNVSERTDEKGESSLLIEYTATTSDSLSMQNCISLMNNVSRHREFTDDKISEKVKTISGNEWVVYYYSKNPWPVEDYDCVAKMTFTENPADKTAVFTLTAVPSIYEKKDVKRMTNYDLSYSFKDLQDGKVEIVLNARMVPAVKFPRWMVKAAFPGVAVDWIQKFVKLAKQIK